MAEGKEKKTTLPWGLSEEVLKPNSVKGISQTKLKAFSLGRTNPLKKANPFLKKKEEREAKKKVEAKEAAQVFEQFVASFQEPSKGVKTFVKGSTINPTTGSETPANEAGSVYKPRSKYLKAEGEEDEVILKPSVTPVTQKPSKKVTDKKKSVLELFREELKRSHEERNERHKQKQVGTVPVDAPETVAESFKVDEYKELMKGSFDTGNPLTTNLYVGNISPKMNEELLCQHFGKFGPLASVKVMWPRTEEERARKRNCGFVAFMKRADAEKALNELNGATIMDYEIMVGWGKAVPLPPNPIYVPPDMEEEEKSKVPDPPSGLPFNAQARRKHGSRFPTEDKPEDGFDEVLYNSIIRVVIPTEVRLLRLIHRMIEFVIREGPMFEAMIMNREINNPEFQFLFDNQSPSHVYYRWKLFSILNGDSPETWRVEEFRMFEGGSVWKPPPLKNLLAKVLPPVQEVVKKGQLSAKKRDELENLLRSISMEREKIKATMVWCMDNSESADEIVECISESLCIEETPLPLKVARLFLVNDILQNCIAHVPNASFFRRGFETKLTIIMEHFHTVFKAIASRIRAEQFKRRVMACLRAWDQMCVYHFNLVDKLRETFIGKSQEELEKQKAFDTVAALIQMTAPSSPPAAPEHDIDGLPLVDNTPIDFSGGATIDGVPIEPSLDETDIDGIPLARDENIDGEPMESDKEIQGVVQVHSKWELVDYDEESDDEDALRNRNNMQAGDTILNKEKQQLLAELDERKRRILRDVELKVVELSDALEATGSYSKQEIYEKVNKFRERLMQEAVEPKRSPPPQLLTRRSRSPSPSTLAKYDVGESPSAGQGQQPASQLEASQQSPDATRSSKEKTPSPTPGKGAPSPPPSASSNRAKSPHKKKQSGSSRNSRSRSPQRKPSPHQRSKSPNKKRSRSRSHSPRQKHSKSRSRSPKQKDSSSPPHPHSHSHKSSKKSKRRSQSRSPHRKSSSSKKSKHHS